MNVKKYIQMQLLAKYNLILLICWIIIIFSAKLKKVILFTFNQFNKYQTRYFYLMLRTKIIAILLFVFTLQGFKITNQHPVEGTLQAAVAYQPPQDIKAWNCTACEYKGSVKMPIVFGNQALQGYVAVLEGTSLLIGFRGPQNPYDIMSYVEKNQPVSYPYCKDCFVHSGFFNAWSIIKNDFIKSLQKELTLFRDIKYIFIAGHGLGAVFSVLAVPEISIVFDRKILMFVDTFGQPPFGDQKFSSYLQNLLQEKNFFIIRSVHNADLIPHEPRLSQYTHIPKDQVWYDEYMDQINHCYFQESEKECSYSLNSYRIEDHPLYEYLKLQKKSIKLG